MGAIIANTVGGVNYVLQQLEALYKKGPRAMSAYTAIAWLHVANVGQAAIRYNIRGYCKTPVNDTVGGLDALGSAYQAIQRGAADVIIAGGCEAMLNPFILLLLSRQKQYLTGSDPQAYRPFDRRAAGLILAEGAGMCIVEELEHAQRRGAPIYGEIVGYGQTNDASGLLPPGGWSPLCSCAELGHARRRTTATGYRLCQPGWPCATRGGSRRGPGPATGLWRTPS